MSRYTLLGPVPIPPSSPAGRVQAAAAYWRREGAPKKTVRLVRNGHLIPFDKIPKPFDISNPPPASREERLARPREFGKLVGKGVLLLAATPLPTSTHVHFRRRRRMLTPLDPVFISPWRLEPKSADGEVVPDSFRYILDLRHLNTHVPDRPFMMQSVALLATLSSPGDRSMCADKRDFFHSFPLHPSHQRFVNVRAPTLAEWQWYVKHTDSLTPADAASPPFIPEALYTMSGLPMGYKLAPHTTHKATRWIIPLIIRWGGALISYCDDDLVIAPSRQIRRIAHRYVQLQVSLGFILHPSKGWGVHTPPKWRFVYLGMGCDLRTRMFFVPPYKQRKLLLACNRTCTHALTHEMMVHPQILARLCGLAVSVTLACPVLPHYTRAAFDHLRGVNWSRPHPVRISRQVLSDLKAMAALSDMWQQSPFAELAPTAVMWTDAPTKGYGGLGHVAGADEVPLHQVSGFWLDPNHVSGQINVLELKAVVIALAANADRLRGRRVQIFTDNRTVKCVINGHTSRSPTVMGCYRELYRFLQANRMQLTAEWLSTLDNEPADTLSRCKDPLEFSYSPLLPALAARRWQLTFSHDPFAAEFARQPNMTFDSRWGSPLARNINTMIVPWLHTDTHWWTPPLNFLTTAIEKIILDQVTGVLLTPDWESAPWWRLLSRHSGSSMRIRSIAEFVVPVPNNIAQPEVLANPRWHFRLWLIIGSPT